MTATSAAPTSAGGWWQARPNATAHLRGPAGGALCGQTPGAGIAMPAEEGTHRCGSCHRILSGHRWAQPGPVRARVVENPVRRWESPAEQWRAIHAELVVFVRRYAGRAQPDVAADLAAAHVDRGDGYCAAVVCGGAALGLPARWPCGLALLAAAAMPGRKEHVPTQRTAPAAEQLEQAVAS